MIRRANLPSLRGEFAPYKFLHKKNLYGRFLDRRLRVQNLMKNLSSFLPTGLKKPRIKSRVSHKFPSPANRHTQFGPGEARFTRDRPGRSIPPLRLELCTACRFLSRGEPLRAPQRDPRRRFASRRSRTQPRAGGVLRAPLALIDSTSSGEQPAPRSQLFQSRTRTASACFVSGHRK